MSKDKSSTQGNMVMMGDSEISKIQALRAAQLVRRHLPDPEQAHEVLWMLGLTKVAFS